MPCRRTDCRSYFNVRTGTAIAQVPLRKAGINGMESFWSMPKRAYAGTFQRLNPKHLNRYVQEFAGKHNVRNLDTLVQMWLGDSMFDPFWTKFATLASLMPAPSPNPALPPAGLPTA